ncbi:aprataxin-like protein [Eupeodes corollae]|uniref:aprataxin-like protein n=1 Tax=Eupeodes corollae TaxID=290404 RepID=UPI00249199EF|nr:aprataxin-like protein [Eupeodes corollae]XP_055904976.1 aprataxin-like protein [Eupeodes corollae]
MAKSYWSTGLIKTLNDPNNHIISNEVGVVIKDKFPKAMHHYLALPKEDIPSIFHLKPSHLDLLSELYFLSLNVIEVKNLQKENFKFGFHAQPSMQRLHLHVISKDFVSPCLKTKKHWNSFNTKLFLPFDELVKDLKENGGILKMDKDYLKELELTELICNQCNHKTKTVPDLKKHLLTHLKNNKIQ